MIAHTEASLTQPSANFAAGWHAGPQNYESPAPAAGTLAVTLPVSDEPGVQVGGLLPWSFLGEWYHRIHIRPTRMDLGNLVAHQVRTFEVWNAHFGSRTLAQIGKSGRWQGIVLSGPPEPPLVYGPLQSFVYTLTAAPVGDPVIEALFVFDFAQETATLELFGRRVAIWVLPPDWAQGITERLEWLTDVFAAYDGREQRMRLRSHARMSVEMRYLAAGRDAAIADSLLAGWSARKYLVPLWMQRDRLATPLAAGANALTVTQAQDKYYRAGGYAIVHAGQLEAEAIEIAAIHGDTLELAWPVSRSYPAGASVLPAMVGYLEGETQGTRPTDRILHARARFVDDQAQDRPATEIGPLWEGYAVLDERPERSADIPESWARTLELLDHRTGIVVADDTSGQPIVRRTCAWTAAGISEIERWRRWAAARAGRLCALWLPAASEEVEIAQDIGAAHTILVIRTTASARHAAAGTPARQAMRIESTAGAVWHRRVLSIAEADPAHELVTLDAPLGTDLPAASVRRAMWMALARLESDAVEIHHLTDSIARIEATFRLLVP